MPEKKRKKEKHHGPTVAPDMEDNRFGEDPTEEDRRKGNVTRVTRVFLDENDPSK